MKTIIKKLLLMVIIVTLFASSVFAGGGGDILRASLVFDNLEYQFSNEKLVKWDIYGYIGYDLNKVYIYSEGEKVNGIGADSENQLVYSRAITPFWDFQFGIGYDKTENADKTWGIAAISGLAPYFFETKLALLVGKDGNIGLRADTEYEALITQKLILTPKFEFNAFTKDELNIDIGSGVSNITLGTRLRYEFVREFAPYIGIEWSKNFGKTNNISPLDNIYIVTGLRVWF